MHLRARLDFPEDHTACQMPDIGAVTTPTRANAAPLRSFAPDARIVAAVAASLTVHLVVLSAPGCFTAVAGNGDGTGTSAMPRQIGWTVHLAAQSPPKHAGPIDPDPVRSAGSGRRSNTSSVSEVPEPVLLPVQGNNFYSADDVEVRAVPVSPIDLDRNIVRTLPPHMIGRLSLRLWIDATGRVEKTEALSSTLPPDISESAASAFAQARFAPARKGGVAVGEITEVEIDYSAGR